jgi:hypothetical protein
MMFPYLFKRCRCEQLERHGIVDITAFGLVNACHAVSLTRVARFSEQTCRTNTDFSFNFVGDRMARTSQIGDRFWPVSTQALSQR